MDVWGHSGTGACRLCVPRPKTLPPAHSPLPVPAAGWAGAGAALRFPACVQTQLFLPPLQVPGEKLRDPEVPQTQDGVVERSKEGARAPVVAQVQTCWPGLGVRPWRPDELMLLKMGGAGVGAGLLTSCCLPSTLLASRWLLTGPLRPLVWGRVGAGWGRQHAREVPMPPQPCHPGQNPTSSSRSFLVASPAGQRPAALAP